MINVLQNIINNGEKIDTEFKLSNNNLPKNLFETVCAFLNRFGGNIVLGVDDDRNIIGIDKEKIEQLKKDFVTLCNNSQKISPTVYLNIEDYEIKGKKVLYINVPDSSEVHRCNNRIYDRNQDGDFDITDNTNLVSNMYIRKKDIHIEDKIFPYATMEDLRSDVFEKAKKWAILKNNNHTWKNMSNEEILKSSGLYREDKLTKEKGITLAAILLFGKDEIIMSCLSHFKTDSIYRDKNIDRYDDREIIITNLIDSYTKLITFVQKHTNDKFYIEDTHSVSVRDKILREICCNLLIHRELSDGTTSRIIITKDEIYTENPNRPKARGFITMNNCMPYSKNPKIAKIFREIGLADELGSGVRNVTKYTKIYSNNVPTFKDGDIFKVSIPLKEEINVGVNVGVNIGVNVGVNKTQEKILILIKENNSITQNEIAKKLKTTSRTVERNISILRKKNIVERIGSDKLGYWKLK